ncbi:MAG: Icc protein [Paraglaciecola sp.]
MKIVQISDCHLFSDREKTAYKQINPYLTLASVLTKIKELTPDLVVASGDISGDKSLQSYQHFSALWRHHKLACELIVIPGNHDDEAHMRAHFPAQQFPLSYAPRSLKTWQMHFLNSKLADDTKGRVSARDLQQLQHDLTAMPDANHIIAVHHHPIDCNGWMDKHEWLNRSDFIAIVRANPQVKGVIYGHIHHASEHLIGKCRLMSAPSTCWQWTNQTDFAVSDELPGFRLLELGENGDFYSHVIRIEGNKN